MVSWFMFTLFMPISKACTQGGLWPEEEEGGKRTWSACNLLGVLEIGNSLSSLFHLQRLHLAGCLDTLVQHTQGQQQGAYKRQGRLDGGLKLLCFLASRSLLLRAGVGGVYSAACGNALFSGRGVIIPDDVLTRWPSDKPWFFDMQVAAGGLLQGSSKTPASTGGMPMQASSASAGAFPASTSRAASSYSLSTGLSELRSKQGTSGGASLALIRAISHSLRHAASIFPVAWSQRKSEPKCLEPFWQP